LYCSDLRDATPRFGALRELTCANKWRMNPKPIPLGQLSGCSVLSHFLCQHRKEWTPRHCQWRSGSICRTWAGPRTQGYNGQKRALIIYGRSYGFLVEQDIIGERILRRKIRLRVPNFLPRAIAPSDVRKILAAVKEARDRALVLVLLRTGMRIGETPWLENDGSRFAWEEDTHLWGWERTALDELCISADDALMALRLWLKKRDKSREYLFYGLRNNLCYSAA